MDFTRILMVDDEPYNLIGLKIVIEAAFPNKGISDIIDTAVNGEDALQKVALAEN